jgi:hypothetical protein
VPDLDLTTVTLADAHLLGGPEFVAQVREDATAVADELAPTGSQGEPVHRESAWSGAAWTLVDAARTALIGQAVPTARGGGVDGHPGPLPSRSPAPARPGTRRLAALPVRRAPHVDVYPAAPRRPGVRSGDRGTRARARLLRGAGMVTDFRSAQVMGQAGAGDHDG